MKCINIESNMTQAKSQLSKSQSEKDLLKRLKKTAKNSCTRVIKHIVN